MGIGLPWFQGQDCWWYDCCLMGQEKVGVWQEECLDCRRHEGKEGIGSQGLRRNQEGLSSLQKGQGTLPVSVHDMPRLQLRVWGCLLPSSADALESMMLL